jgi:hypothetical protein
VLINEPGDAQRLIARENELWVSVGVLSVRRCVLSVCRGPEAARAGLAPAGRTWLSESASSSAAVKPGAGGAVFSLSPAPFLTVDAKAIRTPPCTSP